METIATTRMSSKGQIVIPEIIRKRLNLKEVAQFVVVGEGDVVILKAISAPSMQHSTRSFNRHASRPKLLDWNAPILLRLCREHGEESESC